MRIVVTYDPAPDGSQHPPTVLDSARDDFILMWREWSSRYDGGYLTHLLPVGVYEGISPTEASAALDQLDPHLPDS